METVLGGVFGNNPLQQLADEDEDKEKECKDYVEENMSFKRKQGVLVTVGGGCKHMKILANIATAVVAPVTCESSLSHVSSSSHFSYLIKKLTFAPKPTEQKVCTRKCKLLKVISKFRNRDGGYNGVYKACVEQWL